MSLQRIDALDVNFVDSAARKEFKLFDPRYAHKNKGIGEKRIYVGNVSAVDWDHEFFNFDKTDYFFIKKLDLQQYLKDSKDEYFNPTQKYNIDISTVFTDNENKLENISEYLKMNFRSTVDNQKRFYLVLEGRYSKNNTNYSNWKFLTDICLPRKTKILIVKYLNTINNKFIYYVKPFYMDNIYEPYSEQSTVVKKEDIGVYKTVCQRNAYNQKRFRDALLQRFPMCVVTKVTDDRLLIACHVKSYSYIQRMIKTTVDQTVKKQLENELYDIDNGFLMTPTIHHMYDAGLITFDQEGKLIISDFLSNHNRRLLNLIDNMRCILQKGNYKYLSHHRDTIFNKTTIDESKLFA